MNEKCVAASPLKEAFMLNRTPSSRSTFFQLTPTFLTARLTPTAIGLSVALAAALIVAVLGSLLML